LNTNAASALSPEQRLPRLEDAGSEFPFYNGAPVSIAGPQWGLVTAAVLLGFLVLALPIAWPGGAFGAIIPALLFPVIPLAALAYVAPGHWRMIFGKVGGREVKLMIGFALLTVVVSMIVGGIVRSLVDVTPNAASTQLAAADTAARLAFLGKTIPQLLGEEVVTLLPFLALLSFLSHRFGIGRRTAIIGAWLISSVFFGLLHLPTYDWNLVQCLVIIGTARMVLTLPWILTKNIWVSTGAHIMNDWLLFSVSLLGASLATKV
jgi:membrane protease YdiL (CAAX protease family)